MNEYVIGDLQGCYSEFITLLDKVDFNPSCDTLYLVGDLIARGPDSLKCLDYVYRHQHAVKTVLGNHDLHFIACQRLKKPLNPKDKLHPLAHSSKLHHYLDFLQNQPLAIWLEQHNSLICHAGLSPQLSLTHAMQLAKQSELKYQGDDALYYLKNMYQNQPNCVSNIQTELDAFCYTINAFTRMRFVDEQGNLELSAKGNPENESNLLAWFNYNPENHQHINVIFGHWAALEGQSPFNNIKALDTGCVWGNKMTLLDLKTNTLVVEKSHSPQKAR